MKLKIASLISLAVVVLTGAGCTQAEHQAKPRPEAPPVKRVALAEVAGAAIPENLEVVGTVRARTSAAVLSRISGTLSLLTVSEGDRVQKGQLLARIDSTESLSGSAQAKAAVDEARQGVDEARTRATLADATFDRYRKLYDEQALTRQEFDIKQTERDLATQGVARAESRLRQLQESGRSAAAVADYTTILAPLSGVITAKPAALGATLFPGQPLLTIEDEGSYQLELTIPESLGGKVQPGIPVQVTLAGTGASFSAKIAEVVPAADPASRTFIAKVNLSGAGLKSGAFGRAAIGLGTGATGILAPKPAVFERGALTAVWVVDTNKIARMRLVKPGRMIGDKVEILSGLTAGEKVVVSGLEKVSDGARVEL